MDLANRIFFLLIQLQMDAFSVQFFLIVPIVLTDPLAQSAMSIHTRTSRIVSFCFDLASNGCVYCNVIPNCVTCTDGPACTSCTSGYGLDLTNRMFFLISAANGCISCTLGNCATCVDGPTCTDCQNGFFLNASVSRIF